MPVLTLDYRCSDRMSPLYLKHLEVEEIASLARRQLNYEPSIPFDEGLRRTVAWYAANAVTP